MIWCRSTAACASFRLYQEGDLLQVPKNETVANTTSSAFGPGTEFICMTAAIVGGISFMGGEGNMLGLVTGVFILAMLGNGMQLAGWGTYAQYIVKGIILLGAVTFDEYQKMGRKGKKLAGSPVEKAKA
jgi:ABC-type glucose/galactose transport system permease subunit